MPGSYVIPARFHEGFVRLAELTDADFDRLITAAAATAPRINPHSLFHAIADGSGLEFDAVEEMMGGVLSASTLASRDGIAPGDFAAQVELADVPNQDALRPRLSGLMSLRQVIVTGRALEVALADERTLLRARIVTDLRPVFPGVVDDDQPMRPLAGVVSHKLRLEYLEAGRPGAFVVALDRADVDALREAAERAGRKHETIVEMIRDAGIDLVEIEGEDE